MGEQCVWRGALSRDRKKYPEKKYWRLAKYKCTNFLTILITKVIIQKHWWQDGVGKFIQ